MYASREGHSEIVCMSLTAGADVKAKNKEGLTARRLASKRRHIDIVRMLRKAFRK